MVEIQCKVTPKLRLHPVQHGSSKTQGPPPRVVFGFEQRLSEVWVKAWCKKYAEWGQRFLHRSGSQRSEKSDHGLFCSSQHWSRDCGREFLDSSICVHLPAWISTVSLSHTGCQQMGFLRNEFIQLLLSQQWGWFLLPRQTYLFLKKKKNPNNAQVFTNAPFVCWSPNNHGKRWINIVTVFFIMLWVTSLGWNQLGCSASLPVTVSLLPSGSCTTVDVLSQLPPGSGCGVMTLSWASLLADTFILKPDWPELAL